MKSCSKCRQLKPLHEFGKDKTKKLGVSSRCGACALEAATIWYASNKSRKQQRDRERYARLAGSIRARTAAYYIANRERALQMQKAYCKNNRDQHAAHMAKTKAKRKRGVPPWVCAADFKHIYATARAMTELTGMQHHVDHIVPLCGKKVSGLHVPWNLQILSAEENIQKGNRLPPEGVPLCPPPTVRI